MKYPFRLCHYGFRRTLLRNHYLRCASIGSRFVTPSVYRLLDYPWEAGYILSAEFVGLACNHVLFSLFIRKRIP